MTKFFTYSNQPKRWKRLVRTLQVILLIAMTGVIVSSCSTTSKIPDDDQLFIGLKEIQYKGYDKNTYKDHFIATQTEIEAALATAPNGALFGSPYYRTPFPYGLWIWNWADGSSGKFKKWLNSSFGKAPVLMSKVNPRLRASVAKSVLRNNGYVHGNVTFEEITQRNPKKVKIAYTVHPDSLFLIDSMAYVNFPEEMQELIDSTMRDAEIKKGDPFAVSSLDAERSRLSMLFRNNGYYYYSPGYASYLADTFDVPNRAKLRLQLADSLPEDVLKKWYIGQIRMKMRRSSREEPTDSIGQRFLKIFYTGKRSPIRPRVILRDIKLRPRQAFSYDSYIESIQNINGAGLFSSTDFQFTPRAGTDTLDLDLTCTFDKPWDFYIEGNMKNRTIGRVGPELKVGFTRRNAFRGGEKIDLNLHGSYEWQTGGGGSDKNYYSYGADASVEFPRIIAPSFIINNALKQKKDGRIKLPRRFYSTPWTVAKLSADIIQRPGYYKMHIVSGEWTYKWQTSEQEKHQFSPLTAKYQYKNSQTEKFITILKQHPYLQVTMSDYFIPKMRYTYTYSSRKNSPHPYTWETTLEESGNFVSLLFMARGDGWNQKNKRMFNTPYSQFLKIETDYTKTWPLDSKSKLVGHINIGYIHSYGNATDYPFTEGFYVGGANSVRAFSARTIGPGQFHGDMDRQNAFLYQHGNSKLVLNLEYRRRLFGELHGAIFLDAGNVWAKNRDENYGETSFKLSEHIKQLATGTGLGLRYDLEFLILRVDWGFGLHVPYKTSKSGYFNIERFKDMHTLHLAIGYPF